MALSGSQITRPSVGGSGLSYVGFTAKGDAAESQPGWFGDTWFLSPTFGDTFFGVAPLTRSGTGDLSAQSSSISGVGELEHTGTGSLSSQSSSISGTGELEHTGTGSLSAQSSVISGAGVVVVPGVISGTGNLPAQTSFITGTGTVLELITGTGSLISQNSSISGAGNLITVVTGTGSLVSGRSSISGLDSVPTSVGGGGRGSSAKGYKSFASHDRQKKVLGDILSLLDVEKKVEKEAKEVTPKLETIAAHSPAMLEPIVSPDVVERVVDKVLDKYNPTPEMLEFDISRPEAMSRVESYTREVVESKNDDVLAMTIIMGML